MYFVSIYQGEQDTPVEKPDGEETGLYSQRLVINYQDGTHSDDLITGWMYHKNNIIESVTYTLFITPDNPCTMKLQGYQFQYLVTRDNQQIRDGQIIFDDVNKAADDRTLLTQKTFSPFEFVNYTYPDGVYTITISPSGTIFMDNEQVSLPDEFSFTVEMIDERSVDIGFS